MEPVITGWRRYVLVQPPIMMLIFAQSMSSTILIDLIVYRTCTITLGINKTECLLLHENSSSPEALKIDKQVQPIASLILMSRSFIEAIVPAFLSLFLGPWSDIHGRKPIMLTGYIGVSMTYLILSCMTIWDIGPWFLLIAYIPSSCLGGICIVLLGTICYISDTSNEEERAWQLAWMDALISVGLIVSLLVGPIVFEVYGYTVVLGSATVCCIFATLYVCFLVPETVHNRNSVTSSSLFDINLVKELFKTCTKKRDGFNRYIVWCCISCKLLRFIILEGDSTIGFLFTSAKLGWNVTTYSTYVAISFLLSIFGLIFAVKTLPTYAGYSEEVVAILSVLSTLLSSLVKSFTWKYWHMYISAVVGMFGGVASTMIQSILSKSVTPEDTGKVFSLAVSLETLTPFATASLYNLIYSHFMPPIYPLPVWLVSVAICIIVILLLLHMRIQNAKYTSERYAPLTQDSELTS